MKSVSQISVEIKRIRMEKKLSQKTLAERSGISRATLIAIEQGSSNMTMETFLNLMDTLGMDISMVPKKIERGRVGGRFPNFEEIREMTIAGEL